MLAPAAAVSACLLILYVLAGYPLLLGFLARKCARPVRRGPLMPAVSILIPAYNGELFIEEKLRSILALDYPRDRLEVVVVSDGSTDRTEEIAMRFAADDVRLLRLPRGGKPAALNAAIPSARGEILVLTDVRQRLDPSSVALLVENFADPAVGVASGELVIAQGATHQEANIGLYWRFESWIRDRLSSLDSMFGATGPFYAIRRSLAVPIPPETLLDDVYLPLSAFFAGYRLVVDTRARAYDYPTSLQTEFRRKIRTLAGNYQILLAYPALLGPRNRMWLHFVSYKLGRLLLPWLLIVTAAASFGLPGAWRTTLLAAQAVFYSVALLDPWIPKRFPLKRVSSPIRTFVVMMIAAVGALSVFFVPARSLWKVTSTGKLAEGLKPDVR
jgi:biofilm PGA synthesis N-glycosyltransferase PgaC